MLEGDLSGDMLAVLSEIREGALVAGCKPFVYPHGRVCLVVPDGRLFATEEQFWKDLPGVFGYGRLVAIAGKRPIYQEKPGSVFFETATGRRLKPGEPARIVQAWGKKK